MASPRARRQAAQTRLKPPDAAPARASAVLAALGDDGQNPPGLGTITQAIDYLATGFPLAWSSLTRARSRMASQAVMVTSGAAAASTNDSRDGFRARYRSSTTLNS